MKKLLFILITWFSTLQELGNVMTCKCGDKQMMANVTISRLANQLINKSANFH